MAAEALAADPVGLPTRLLRLSRYDPATGCREWVGYKTAGYGRVRYKRRLWLAHRVAYQETVGDIGAWQVLHRCDNPACINPAHLFLGSPAINAQDRGNKGRHALGERSGRARLTAAQVLELRAAGNLSNVKIAARLGVGTETVRLARKGLTWRHLP